MLPFTAGHADDDIYYGLPTPEYAPYTYGRPDRAALVIDVLATRGVAFDPF